MTSTSYRDSAADHTTPQAAAVPPTAGGVDVIDLREAVRVAAMGLLWSLATCVRCDPPLAQPFRTEAERDDWAADHVATTGHVVSLSTDGLDDIPNLHLTGIISRDQNGEYRFVCPADDCGRSNGPYTTATIAIASWRRHPIRRKPVSQFLHRDMSAGTTPRA